MPVPRGFLFSGVHSGIKPSRKDLALIFSEMPATAAAALTTSRARAAPVADLAARLPAEGARAVVVNSGNANALTGAAGREDVTTFCARTAAELGVPPGAVFMASTGVIGQRLPLEKMVAALPALKRALAPAPEMAAEAILTTDTHLKIASRKLQRQGGDATILGLCKGSGMIAPQLATVIAVICTDLPISPDVLHRALTTAMNPSFNSLNIDGSMSPNDTVLALANGAAGGVPLCESGGEYYDAFLAALTSLCVELAREIARDGEGATKMLAVTVTGAPSSEAASDLAKSIVGSPLVKAAMFGADPNWGRILATVGARAGTQDYPVDPEAARVAVQDVVVYDGKPVHRSPDAQLRARLRAPEVKVEVDVRSGAHTATAWGCDLSYDYVKLNADYTSLLVANPDGSVGRDDRLTNYTPKFKATILAQALGYIARFADKRVVVKLGKAAMRTDSSRAGIVEDVRLLRAVGMVPILVHAENHADGGPLTGQTNLDLVTMLNRVGVPSIGLSGMDASFLSCTRGVNDLPGDVVSVNPAVLEMFLSKQYLPVVAAVGFAADGAVVMVDADRAAMRIAIAVHAAKLVFLGEKLGFTDADELLAQLTATDLRSKLAAGTVSPGLAHKAACALDALAGGVEHVHVLDARSQHAMIAEFFTEQGIGSMVLNG